jgi:hypothetical protein
MQHAGGRYMRTVRKEETHIVGDQFGYMYVEMYNIKIDIK